MAHLYRQSSRGVKLQRQNLLKGMSSKKFSSNQHPRKPITTFQAPPIDCLHGQLGLAFGNHDSQVANTWERSVVDSWPPGLVNHVGDVNLGIHDFAEFAPSTRLC